MNTDLVWAIEWLNTLCDRLTGDHMVDEFKDELAQRRRESVALDEAAKEASK